MVPHNKPIAYTNKHPPPKPPPHLQKYPNPIWPKYTEQVLLHMYVSIQFACRNGIPHAAPYAASIKDRNDVPQFSKCREGKLINHLAHQPESAGTRVREEGGG